MQSKIFMITIILIGMAFVLVNCNYDHYGCEDEDSSSTEKSKVSQNDVAEQCGEMFKKSYCGEEFDSAKEQCEAILNEYQDSYDSANDAKPSNKNWECIESSLKDAESLSEFIDNIYEKCCPECIDENSDDDDDSCGNTSYNKDDDDEECEEGENCEDGTTSKPIDFNSSKISCGNEDISSCNCDLKPLFLTAYYPESTTEQAEQHMGIIDLTSLTNIKIEINLNDNSEIESNEIFTTDDTLTYKDGSLLLNGKVIACTKCGKFEGDGKCYKNLYANVPEKMLQLNITKISSTKVKIQGSLDSETPNDPDC